MLAALRLAPLFSSRVVVSMLEVSAQVHIPDTEFELSFARSSGPGGQNVNKVNSKVVFYWNVLHSPSIQDGVRQRFLAAYGTRINDAGVLLLQSDLHRDQKRNIQDCRDKLLEMLKAVLVPPKTRRKTKPTKGSKQRRLTGKKEQKEKKANRQKPEY